MIAYAISAGASIYMVHFTKKAQSALMYIVPALIVSTLVVALTRNELCAVLSCSDIIKTFQKIGTFSAEEDNDDEENERPVRFRRSSIRGRNTSVTRGGRRGSSSRGRSKSKVTEVLETTISSESDDGNFEAKLDRTIEDDVLEEHEGPKARKKRSASKKK